MHMADALLSPAVGCVMYAASAGATAYAVQKIKKNELGEKKLPMMAVSGAFVFAAQMINFTIPVTGSSGHIGGGVLLAGLLGGEPALLTILAVLVIQCLFFADGGLLALGANVFNMGVIPCMMVYPILFRTILRHKRDNKHIAIASILSAVIGLQLGAFGVVLETTASGITELPFSTFVLLMQPIHLAIGLVEGIVTAAVLIFVHQMRPEILENALDSQQIQKTVSTKKVIAVLAVLALVLAGGVSLFASSHPDGLEWSMEQVAGTTELERSDAVHKAAADMQNHTSILPDYDFANGEGNGTSIAGIAGAAMTCILAGGIGVVLSVRRRKQEAAKK